MYRVVFTIKTPEGEILAQASSNSIMITDDHKQPVPAAAGFSYTPAAQLAGAGLYGPAPGYGLYQTFAQELPFRPSWSTNDLRLLGNQYAPVHPSQLSRQPQYDSYQSTASTTPRNLSRPASPTDPSGQPGAKKRRSGGLGHNRMPSGLTMTRLETQSPAAAAHGVGPMGGGLPSSGFSFASPATATFSNAFDQSLQSVHASNHNLTSNPATPHEASRGFRSPGAVDNDLSQFYSAPTSQKHSRAPSPSLGSRNKMHGGHGFQDPPVPEQVARALANLPSGLNIQNPPKIQRLVPSSGPTSGHNEVIILGRGFFQGLEVMFGDVPALSMTWWGDSTLLCTAPPAQRPGVRVPVCFRHQHHTAEGGLRELQALMATTILYYCYVDNDDVNGPTSIAPTQMSLQSPPGSAGLNNGTLKEANMAMGFFGSRDSIQ